MHRIALPERGTFEAWRDAARTLAGHDIPPEAVEWTLGDAGAGLFGSDPLPPGPGHPLAVPRAFLDLAETVILHRDPAVPALLYQALTGLQRRPRLLADAARSVNGVLAGLGVALSAAGLAAMVKSASATAM